MSLYPTEEEITMFGEKMKYPGLKDGKFTNGSFSNPKQLASFIPAETLNLILDNLGEAIKSVGLEPNNTNINQLVQALDIRTKYIIQEAILDDIIHIEIPYKTEIISSDTELFYNKSINLKQKLAEKLQVNEEDIKIVNWNLLSDNTNSAHNNKSCFASKDVFDNYSNKVIGFPSNMFVIDYNKQNYETLSINMLIQIADELTKSIEPIVFNGSDENFIINYQKFDSLKALYYSLFLGGYLPLKHVAKLSPYTFSSINLRGGFEETEAITFTREAYYMYLDNISFDNVKSYVFNFKNLYNFSQNLFFGDYVKIRMKNGTKGLYAYMDMKFSIAIRYAIMKKTINLSQK